MSINTAHKLASARPLTPAQLRKYRIDDLDRSLGNEFRAQRAVLSRGWCRVGVKRYLQPQVAALTAQVRPSRLPRLQSRSGALGVHASQLLECQRCRRGGGVPCLRLRACLNVRL